MPGLARAELNSKLEAGNSIQVYEVGAKNAITEPLSLPPGITLTRSQRLILNPESDVEWRHLNCYDNCPFQKSSFKMCCTS